VLLSGYCSPKSSSCEHYHYSPLFIPSFSFTTGFWGQWSDVECVISDLSASSQSHLIVLTVVVDRYREGCSIVFGRGYIIECGYDTDQVSSIFFINGRLDVCLFREVFKLNFEFRSGLEPRVGQTKLLR